LTGKQRFLTALNGGRPDRVPIFLRDLTLGLDLCDLDTSQVSGGYDSVAAVQAVVASQRRFHQDAVVGCIHDLGLDVEAFGGHVEFPRRGIPFVARAPFADADRLREVRSVDPAENGRWPAVIETYRLVKQQLGDDVAIAANIEGPVTRAGVLRGLDKLAMDLMRRPALAAELVELSTTIAEAHVRSLAGAGADLVFVAAASDGPAAISPTHYAELTIPGLRRIVAAARDCDLPVVFHPHGPFTDPRFRELVDMALDCGIQGFQFGEGCDLSLARELWGDRACILGGPDVPEVLLPGPVEKVRRVTADCLDRAMGTGGFVLMASCSLHRNTPSAHIDAMVETALARGQYTQGA